MALGEGYRLQGTAVADSESFQRLAELKTRLGDGTPHIWSCVLQSHHDSDSYTNTEGQLTNQALILMSESFLDL